MFHVNMVGRMVVLTGILFAATIGCKPREYNDAEPSTFGSWFTGTTYFAFHGAGEDGGYICIYDAKVASAEPSYFKVNQVKPRYDAGLKARALYDELDRLYEAAHTGFHKDDKNNGLPAWFRQHDNLSKMMSYLGANITLSSEDPDHLPEGHEKYSHMASRDFKALNQAVLNVYQAKQTMGTCL